MVGGQSGARQGLAAPSRGVSRPIGCGPARNPCGYGGQALEPKEHPFSVKRQPRRSWAPRGAQDRLSTAASCRLEQGRRGRAAEKSERRKSRSGLPSAPTLARIARTTVYIARYTPWVLHSGGIPGILPPPWVHLAQPVWVWAHRLHGHRGPGHSGVQDNTPGL